MLDSLHRRPRTRRLAGRLGWGGRVVMTLEQRRPAVYADVLEACRQRLLEFCDPLKVDERAKRRQAELLAKFGGREAALARGDLGFTPAPGTKPEVD